MEGYVQLQKDEKEKTEEKSFDLDKLKDLFIDNSRKKNISYEKMKELWPIFLLEHENQIKKIFDKKAKEMKFNDLKTKKAWLKYKKNLETF